MNIQEKKVDLRERTRTARKGCLSLVVSRGGQPLGYRGKGGKWVNAFESAGKIKGENMGYIRGEQAQSLSNTRNKKRN